MRLRSYLLLRRHFEDQVGTGPMKPMTGPPRAPAGDPEGSSNGLSFSLVFVIAFGGTMVWAGASGMLSGVVEVVVMVVVSTAVAGIAGGIVESVAGFVGGTSNSSETQQELPNADVSVSISEAKPRQHAPTSSAPLPLSQLNPALARRLREFKQLAAERPDFTEGQRERVLKTVRTFQEHRRQYDHIVSDPHHPDHRQVSSEMQTYAVAVDELLRQHCRELRSGSHGSFSYQMDLRTAQGAAELARDPFEELNADHRRKRPDPGFPDPEPSR